MKRHGSRPPAPGGVAIIGPGRLGQALGKVLRQAGVPVRLVAGRERRRAERAVRFIGGGRAVAWGDPEIAEAAVVVLTVADSAIGPVARQLAGLRSDWRGRVTLHTCGSLGPEALQPLRARGAAVGVLHPFQAVPQPSAGARSLRGCYWNVDGDAPARTVARQWVKRLDGRHFRILPGRQALYHLAAFLVCPTTLTLMDQSEKWLRRAGVPRRMIRGMLAQFVSETARNYQAFGGRRALTGPVVRGDWQTVRKHLRVLRRGAPETVDAYSALVGLMARLARQPLPSLHLKR